MRQPCLLCFTFLCLLSTLHGQIEADCADASYLKLTRDSSSFPFPTAPDGYGKLQEISAPAKDPYFFRKEHHTAWYKFQTPFTGSLSLEIIPYDVKNDYDFLLFQDTTGRLCDQVLHKEIKPIRSVISRNDTSIQSVTGLSAYAGQLHIQEGPGSSYGESIKVKKGDRFYLVLDNVYGGGRGHQIDFHYYFPARLQVNLAELGSGKSLTSKTTIILSDTETGIAIDSVVVQPSSHGVARLNPLLEFDRDYTIHIQSDDYFDKEIPYKRSKRPLSLELFPKKKDVKIVFKDINFYGDSDEFLPSAKPSLLELYEMMRNYPSLKIEIGGHVNAPVPRGMKVDGRDSRYQTLSDDRAAAVRTFLIDKGIHSDRMTSKGYAATQMLFPHATNERDMSRNRRVEIKVLDF